jgi:amidase
MARNVADVALMLDAGAGFAASDPLSFDSAPGEFSAAVATPGPLTRVAFSADLGQVPMSREIAKVCEAAALQCGSLGAEVTDDIPDFSGVADGFQTLRAVLIATMMGELYEKHRDAISPDIVGNIERGINLTPDEIFDAHQVRWMLHQQLCRFFENHDVMICPAVSVEPFPVDQNYVTSIDGKALDTYIDWFAVTFILSMSACPVLSLPCGFTQSGLPVGLQLMGKPRGEAELLSVAAQLEPLISQERQLPIDPQPGD